LLSFLWHVALTHAIPVQSDRETDGFVGPVRSVVIETAKLLPARLGWQQDVRHQAHIVEWLEEPRMRVQTMTYDAQGKRYDTAFYNEHGMLRWQWRYTYTPEGRIQTRISTDTGRDPRWTIRYLYDAAGRVREKLEVAADQALARRWQYLYDAQGLLVEETNFDSYGTLLWKWRYTYNTQGQRVEESNHTANGAILWKRRYVYDTHQRLTEEYHYDAAASLLWQRHYTYDTHGDRSEEVLYNGNGTLQSRWRYTYEGYDPYGNWLKRTEAKWVQTADHADFAPVQVTYRTLRYH
jgi:YD repeat-containing protein